jgi:hypothetical protein
VAARLSSLQIRFQLRPYNIKGITQQNKERRVANGFEIFGHFDDLIYKNRLLFSYNKLGRSVKNMFTIL